MRRTFTISRDAASLEPDEERRRVLRDLHDSVGPTLAAAALGLHAARNLIGKDRAAAERILVRLEEELHSAIAEIRRLANDVHPPVLDRVGLVAAIRLYAETLSSRTGGQLDIEIDALGRIPELPPAVEVAAYRIAREALTNVSRHSNARRCAVRIRFDDELQLEIVDDGTGAGGKAVADRPGGVGLSSMRERACALGGELAVERATPGGGTKVIAILPVGSG